MKQPGKSKRKGAAGDPVKELGAAPRSIVLTPAQVCDARSAVLHRLLAAQEELELLERAVAETPRKTQSHLDATRRVAGQRALVRDWTILRDRFQL